MKLEKGVIIKKQAIVWIYYNKKMLRSQVITFCKFCNQSYIQTVTCNDIWKRTQSVQKMSGNNLNKCLSIT